MKTTEILERLQKVNFTPEQAREIADILETGNSDLVTKTDFREGMAHLKTDLQREIEHLKTDLQKEILQSKFDMVKWIVGGVIANGLVATLLKYLG